MSRASRYNDDACMQKLEAAAALLRRKLKNSGLSTSECNQWLTSVHQFPPEPASPEVFTLHVYRANWFNHDRQGIHFETFMGPKEWKRKEVQIAMHIFHFECVPGTSIKRRAIAVPFVDEIYDMVSSWDGYRFRAGKYGAHPFTRKLPVEHETFEERLSAELLRMCLALGPVMDKTLASVLGTQWRH
ncbi:MAG: hypothetical protein DKT66_11375 [Candidatus Melainabacteria bacterium]|nr:MAG: hypothetical protein DKT66_11375 [Candidatus Melainabacteria bacterium]